MYPAELSWETMALCDHEPVPGTPPTPQCVLDLLMPNPYPPTPRGVYPNDQGNDRPCQ